MPFVDRVDAGRRLAEQLRHLRGEDVVILGLPRGGVPVAFEVARALSAPLDIIVVRKLGVPFQPELGMGAIGEDGVLIRTLRDEVDEVVCLETPPRFYAVGQWYADFQQTSDAQVMDLLRRSKQAPPVVAAAGPINDDPPLRDEEVEVSSGPLRLAGHLTVPEQPTHFVRSPDG